MLLNLTNHPASSWPENQLIATKKLFGTIEDYPFPQIDPAMDHASLDKLVEDFVQTVRKKDPTAIHIMGELTFTYRLVNRLKELGYRCIASTTTRKVTYDEQGNKISTFKFVQFREY